MHNALQPVWESYVAAWKATAPADKLALFAQSLAPDCEYNDPLGTAKGFEPLLAYMKAFHAQVPGGYFVTDYFAAHHQRSMAKWSMCNAAGQIIGDGISFGQYNEQGKLVFMTGFYETP